MMKQILTAVVILLLLLTIIFNCNHRMDEGMVLNRRGISVSIQGSEMFDFFTDTIYPKLMPLDTLFAIKDTLANITMYVNCDVDKELFWKYNNYPNNLTEFEKNVHAEHLVGKPLNGMSKMD